MAIVEKFIASVELWDVAGHKASASVRVGATDARAYAAAANQAARDATKVGLLLLAALNMTSAAATNFYQKWSLQIDFVNDGAVKSNVAGAYISNKWRVTGNTTNAGLPVLDSFYIPMRSVGLVMESNGVNAALTDTEAADLVTQVVDTALSKYLTAFTSVNEIVANDL